MIEVAVIDWTPNHIMDVVRELRAKGYKQGTHFDFMYHPPKFDNFSGEAVYNRKVVFTFYVDELATWFELVYK